MRRFTLGLFSIAVLTTAVISAQPPGAPTQPPPGAPGAQAPGTPAPAPGAQRGGGRGGQRGSQVMTLTSTAWPDGGVIPPKYTQAGEQVSPALSWSNVPEGIGSFVLIFRDMDAATGNGTDDVLHWMVWNIPPTTRSLPEGVPQGPMADNMRQISVSGPYYRGPGAPASGPPHHYVFELYAIDGTIDVAAVGQSPQLTRAAVVAAMAGRVRGKAVYSGLFKRATP